MIFVICVILLLLFVLSMRGRVHHKGADKLQGWLYAHRGLHGEGVPENSLEAFRRAVSAGYGAELDVHLLRDGELAVIHDSQLRRTTGREGRIEDLSAPQLCEYNLEGTEYTVPLLKDVLHVFGGRTPLIIELKSAGNNISELCERTCELLDGYRGVFCLESFDPRCIRWLRVNRPDIVRGQLTEDYFRNSQSKLPWFLKFALKHQMLNFWTMPDFIAYRYGDRVTISNFICRKIWNLLSVSWTIKNRQQLDTALSEGWIPIFEDFEP